MRFHVALSWKKKEPKICADSSVLHSSNASPLLLSHKRARLKGKFLSSLIMYSSNRFPSRRAFWQTQFPQDVAKESTQILASSFLPTDKKKTTREQKRARRKRKSTQKTYQQAATAWPEITCISFNYSPLSSWWGERESQPKHTRKKTKPQTNVSSTKIREGCDDARGVDAVINFERCEKEGENRREKDRICGWNKKLKKREKKKRKRDRERDRREREKRRAGRGPYWTDRQSATVWAVGSRIVYYWMTKNRPPTLLETHG